ncbi:DUF11 domain-containing protein [Cohnella soli]|uniref:DUF11 domain-containing protein n=1 Tax=Cohnella soli TaxID=425005 RepID=A0ABW0HJ01_9BACL
MYVTKKIGTLFLVLSILTGLFVLRPTNIAYAATTADLDVKLTVDKPKVNMGDTVTFTATVKNLGPDTATNVSILAELPLSLTYVHDTPSQGMYYYGSGVWRLGDVTSGNSSTLTITAKVSFLNPTPFSIYSYFDQMDNDPNPANNIASSTITLQQADLDLKLTVDKPTVNIGDTVTYTATVKNLGPDTATNVSIFAVLPLELTLVNAVPSQGTYNSGSGMWWVGNVTSGSQYTLTITARVSFLYPSTFSISAYFDQIVIDPNPANNIASSTITLQQADLGVQLAVNNPTPNVGDTITYTATITNSGPDTATNVSVNALLPAGVTFDSATPSQGTYNSATGVWTVGTIMTGNQPTLGIAAKVVSLNANTSTITVAHSDQFDLDQTNNSTSSTINPSDDLGMQLIVSNPTPDVGDVITYTATISNSGPDVATNVSVNALLPAGVTFDSATPSQGTYNSVTGVWTVGTVTAGDPPKLTITTKVVSPNANTFTTTLAHSDQIDPNHTNNSASSTITPKQADLGATLTVSNSSPNVGDTITYTATISNSGPASATNVSVNTLFPAGVTFVSATPSQGTYNSATGVWTVGTITTGTPPTLTITATVVSPNANTSTITVAHSNQFDPDQTNNSASSTITPQQADLRATLAVSNSSPNVGDTITYTATIKNSGPDTATNVSVSALLPAGVTFVSANPSQGTYNSATGVWTVGTVTTGTPPTLTITATVASPNANTFTITVAHSDQFDPDTGNNSSLTMVSPIAAPIVTSISVNPTNFMSIGGSTTATIVGTNLTGHRVEVYLDGAAAATAIVNSATSATATVVIPHNTTTSDVSHSLTVYVDGVAIVGKSATVTVKGTSVEPTTTIPTTPSQQIDQNGAALDPNTVDTTKPSVTLEANPKDGAAYVSIPASIFASFEEKNATFIIEVKAPFGSYQIPVDLASLIPELKDLLAGNNLKAEDIRFKITLTDKSDSKDIKAAFGQSLPNGKVIGPIVDFHIDIINTSTGKTIG